MYPKQFQHEKNLDIRHVMDQRAEEAAIADGYKVVQGNKSITPQFPCWLYSEDGDSKLVYNDFQRKSLLGKGYATKPFPQPPKDEPLPELDYMRPDEVIDDARTHRALVVSLKATVAQQEQTLINQVEQITKLTEEVSRLSAIKAELEKSAPEDKKSKYKG